MREDAGFACPAGHAKPRPFRPADGCSTCRADAALAEVVALLGDAGIDAPTAEGAVTTVAATAAERRRLADWLRAHPDGLCSGDSECPPAPARLIAVLEELGIEVTRPRCLDCGKPRWLPQIVDGGRVCFPCSRHRTAEPCARCARRMPVAGRLPDGRGVCFRCRSHDRSTWRPCGRCGALAWPVAVEDDVTTGRCCYLPPLIRCTVCGVAKGVKPYKTRRPVCAACAERPRVRCGCGLDAAIPAVGEPAVCARCRQGLPEPCVGCGVPTAGRARDKTPRCPDCYRRAIRACGRCGRVRAIVRLATGDDPDLCGVCWTGPVMTCEGCGRVRPCRGERKGLMLCMRCRRVAPQRCSHCAASRQPTAQWPEGPVCQSCYRKALAAKGDCPGCGRLRRLRRYPHIDEPTCADCAGMPTTNVCTACGIEDLLWDRGLCPRCSLERRLGLLLGGEDRRAASGLEPLFAALAAAESPRAVLDWLTKSKTAVAILDRLGTGELACTWEAIDTVEDTMVRRHLEHLLAATGTLAARDPVLATLERWCEHFLTGLDDPEIAKLLRTYVRWQVLRPLRADSQQAPLTETRGYAARVRLKRIAAFATWLNDQGTPLSECRQVDVDTWCAANPRHRVQPMRAFVAWAAQRKAMPRLDVPAVSYGPPNPAADHDQRWEVARRLLHEPGFDTADRVAGALVVIYAQPLVRIANLTVDDLRVDRERVSIRLGDTAIELPEPLADHARELLANRRPTGCSIAKLPTDPGWLFPGAAPARHMRADPLGKRLRRFGVQPGRHRQTALLQLAAEIPAALLPGLLGISPITANVWSRLAGRSWGAYVGMRTSASS